MKNILFGRRIDPACEYCEKGRPSKDGQMIFCEKRGVVSPLYSCRHFSYDPLRRRPRQIQVLPAYSDEDFRID